MKKTLVALMVVLAARIGFSGSMSWQGGPIAADSHVIAGSTLVEIYLDSGDSLFTWGGEGAVIQSDVMKDFGDPSGYYFGSSYDYGVNQGAKNFWAVYHDVGANAFSVSFDGIHSVANDTVGNATDDWNVGNPSTWQVVPEPSTVALVLVGLGIVGYRRFRNA